MANFAYQAGRSGLSTNSYNTTPIPGGAHQYYNYTDPKLGFEYFLSQLNPSLSQDRTLRQLYDQLWGRFGHQAMNNPTDSSYKWMDWLGRQDINKELANLHPSMRGERPDTFMRPARWVAFT
jgi:hypothetical protein